MIETASLLMTMPELLLTGAGLILLMVATFAGDNSARLVGWLAVAALAVAGLSLNGLPSTGGEAFDGLYRADAFGAFAKVLIYVAAAVSIIIAPRFFATGNSGIGGAIRAEYPVLIIFATVGMGLMVSAGDMLTLYVGLELNSLAAYVLASFMRQDGRSAEAGLKYFVLGALASGILLYGISLLYGFTGSTTSTGIAAAMADGLSNGERFGLVVVLAALAFKISAVPFHMWTPDVYEGAPTPVTAFFASAPKVAAMALLVRVSMEAMGSALESWQQIVIFVALASILFGAVAAIGQSNIKRLLAYSSINNVGFALIGLAAGTAEGVAAVMSYLAIYVVMTLGSFLCVLQMRDADGNPAVADHTWISYYTGQHLGNNNGEAHGKLTAGYGARGANFAEDSGKIGPEFGFGQILGDYYASNDVLVIKCAWGGRDLAEKFRPPSAVADRGGQVGDFYSAIIDYTREVLTNLGTEFPEWSGQGYEIVGFGWHQGYNDRISGPFSAEYKDNLPDLIEDLRTVFNKPSMPFVIASTGMATGLPEAPPYSGYSEVEKAQLWVAGVTQPASVLSTDTRPFWRDPADSPATSGQGFHWNHNAETLFLIGKSMGDNMVTLLAP